jgi:hypothetical protein
LVALRYRRSKVSTEIARMERHKWWRLQPHHRGAIKRLQVSSQRVAGAVRFGYFLERS